MTDNHYSIRIGHAGRSITINLDEPSAGPSLAVQLARGAHHHQVSARIEVVVDGFRASYIADLFGGDLPAFREGFARLYSFEAQEAALNTTKRELSIEIKGDGRGHFRAKCVARKYISDTFPTLTFTLEFDQTDVPAIMAELDAVLGRVS